MAYSTSNPPQIESYSPCGAHKTFYYESTHTVGAADATGFFTNGQDLGMAVGDLVKVYDTATPKLTLTYVSSVTSTGVTVIIEAS